MLFIYKKNINKYINIALLGDNMKFYFTYYIVLFQISM